MSINQKSKTIQFILDEISSWNSNRNLVFKNVIIDVLSKVD